MENGKLKAKLTQAEVLLEHNLVEIRKKRILHSTGIWDQVNRQVKRREGSFTEKAHQKGRN